MVVSVDFSTRFARNLVYKSESELLALIPEKQYQALEQYVEESLTVYLNGQMLDRVSDNGFVILSSTVFELKVAKRTRDVLTISYLRY